MALYKFCINIIIIIIIIIIIMILLELDGSVFNTDVKLPAQLH